MMFLLQKMITFFFRSSEFFSFQKYFSKTSTNFLLILILLANLAACSSDTPAPQPEPKPEPLVDTDGDGIYNSEEIMNGTDINNPCDPLKTTGYSGYDSNNSIWSNADCDADGLSNYEEVINGWDPYLDDRVYVIPELLPKLSDLKLFDGNLADLKLYNTSVEYDFPTDLFIDYGAKLRSISIPKGTKITYEGPGLLGFPDNTVLTMTIYFLNDGTNPSLGKRTIETWVLIKKNAEWEMGNYIWNEAQTDALLAKGNEKIRVPLNFISVHGKPEFVNYEITSANSCIKCHNINGAITPIGVKARSLNTALAEESRIQLLKDKNLLTGAPEVSQIPYLTAILDTSEKLEDRARAYMDMNCAHCHQPGGFHDSDIKKSMDLRFETTFANSKITMFKDSILKRISAPDSSAIFMPSEGTTISDEIGVDLLKEYLNSLQ